ncbi:hypothetical protein L6164_015608 [Bauhinia variegata]|nr:hypothetical protein L6164_015608 [Bauhinia variegata]
MNESNNGRTRKRLRKNEKKGDGSSQTEGDKKKELKGILTSLILLEEQERREQEELDKASEQDKLSLDANHKKKKTMLEYYSNIEDYYSDVEESERIKRKKSRAMAGAVAVSAASDGLEKVQMDKGLKSGAAGGPPAPATSDGCG